MRRSLALLPFLITVGCNPYQRRDGEYYAGPVDPAAFPAAYLGAGGDPKRGGGVFNASQATAHGVSAPYYAFALSAEQAASPDPLAVSTDGNPTAVPAPLAYVFDPTPPTTAGDGGAAMSGNADPSHQCKTPAGWTYDARKDGFRLDLQGQVFTGLPSAGYAPVVAEVPVTSNGEGCQDIKSSDTLVQASTVKLQTKPPKFPVPNALPTGVPDGNFLAWAIIDPGATVLNPDGSTSSINGLGPQKLGWFNHYLVAYLDGGYIPTMSVTVPGMAGNPDVQQVHMITQNVYFPTQIPTVLPSGVTVVRAGKLGSGYDLLDFKRGVDANYSPLCHVFSFVPVDPLHPITSASDIVASTLHDTGTFVYCLQVTP